MEYGNTDGVFKSSPEETRRQLREHFVGLLMQGAATAGQVPSELERVRLVVKGCILVADTMIEELEKAK